MIRAPTLALVGASAFFVASAVTSSTASATPGMVTASGCHSRTPPVKAAVCALTCQAAIG